MSTTPYTLQDVLRPRSVAIIGVSRAPEKMGHIAAKQLLATGFPGDVYLITSSAHKILGRTTYSNLQDVSGQIDLAVIATPYEAVENSVADCIAHGVKGIVIITGGFGETGPEGRALEQRMAAHCSEHGVRLIGSNCMGVFVRSSRLNALGLIFPLPTGPLGLITQSGNLGVYFYSQAHAAGLGFTTFLSLGNSIDVSFLECLYYLAEEPETGVIAGYIETQIDEEALCHLTQDLRRRSLYKPIVILPGGTTEAGMRAILAHTGTLAVKPHGREFRIHKSGVVQVLRSDELFPIAQALATQPPTPGGKRRIAIISEGGGSCVVTADACVYAGLQVPLLSAETQELLRALLPTRATVTNPIDATGATDEDPLLFAQLVDICLKDPEIDGVILTGLFGGYRWLLSEAIGLREEPAARELGELVQRSKKPILIQTIYAHSENSTLQALRDAGIPYYESVEITCRAMAALAEIGEFLSEN